MKIEREHCEHCGRDTVTVLLPLSSGHIGRVCACCRACRKGRPFASKAEFENLKNMPMVTHDPRAKQCQKIQSF